MPLRKSKRKNWDETEFVDEESILEKSNDGKHIRCKLCNGKCINICYPFGSSEWNRHVNSREHRNNTLRAGRIPNMAKGSSDKEQLESETYGSQASDYMPFLGESKRKNWDDTEFDDEENIQELSDDGMRISCRLCHQSNGKFIHCRYAFGSTEWNRHVTSREHRTNVLREEQLANIADVSHKRGRSELNESRLGDKEACRDVTDATILANAPPMKKTSIIPDSDNPPESRCPGFTYANIPNDHLLSFMKYGMRPNDPFMGKFRIVVPTGDEKIAIQSADCSGFVPRYRETAALLCNACFEFKRENIKNLRERVQRMPKILLVEKEIASMSYSIEGKHRIESFLSQRDTYMNDNKKELKQRCRIYLDHFKALNHTKSWPRKIDNNTKSIALDGKVHEENEVALRGI